MLLQKNNKKTSDRAYFGELPRYSLFMHIKKCVGTKITAYPEEKEPGTTFSRLITFIAASLELEFWFQ